jgi:tetrahydromethanopterin S-methyltransferase subunit F
VTITDKAPPVPDPTVLTTAQLLREIDRIKELVDSMLIGRDAVTIERFSSVDRQFSLVEQQRVEQKEDTKAAVDAALTAQKEAVREQTLASERAIAKSEAATTKQLEQLGATFSAAVAGVETILQDLKDRITRIESLKQGGKDTVNGIYAMAGFIVTALTLVGILAAAGVFRK